jgi:hypothetical protein
VNFFFFFFNHFVGTSFQKTKTKMKQKKKKKKKKTEGIKVLVFSAKKQKTK